MRFAFMPSVDQLCMDWSCETWKDHSKMEMLLHPLLPLVCALSALHSHEEKPQFSEWFVSSNCFYHKPTQNENISLVMISLSTYKHPDFHSFLPSREMLTCCNGSQLIYMTSWNWGPRKGAPWAASLPRFLHPISSYSRLHPSLLPGSTAAALFHWGRPHSQTSLYLSLLITAFGILSCC